ncbi:MAG: hypothetical protein JJ992_17495, partial [Planctomycetes bacterium]|nr:hypothetical protein [Planctomycetota bacterium]
MLVLAFGSLVHLAPIHAQTIQPPEFVGKYETDWSSSGSSKTTQSFNVLADDVLVAYAMTENEQTSVDIAGGGLAWTPQELIDTSGYGWLAIWTTTIDSDEAISVTFTPTGSGVYGGTVLHFGNTDGIGASGSSAENGSAPSLDLATTQSRSTIVVANVDWNAIDGSARSWRQAPNGINETTYAFEPGRYTVYGGYYADVGPAASNTYGLVSPTTQRYSLAAVEVLGASNDSGAGTDDKAPLLVITSDIDPLTGYYPEILRAEGLNLFETAEIGTVTATMLSGYDSVLLGEIPLLAGEVTMLSDWVYAGGSLIAMRPDKQLAGLFGITDVGATLDDGYVLVNTAAGPGSGITAETMQYHSTADLYALSGATSYATLYADATTPTQSPAVVIRQVGDG